MRRSFSPAVLCVLIGCVGCAGTYGTDDSTLPTVSESPSRPSPSSSSSSAESSAPPAPSPSSSSSNASSSNPTTPDVPYPAPHSDVAQSATLGGPMLTSPHVYVITFANDPNRGAIEDFAATVGTTTYWSSALAAYGIGALTSTPLRATNNSPASIDDTNITADIAADIANGTFPAPDANSIYAVFLPASTTVTAGGQTLCTEIGAYHNDAPLKGSSARFAYAVIPTCSDLDELTYATSHELIEAATDPFYSSTPAHILPDLNHILLAELFSGGEIADLCQFADNAEIKPAGFSYSVQRVWNNVAAEAGHDPCQPSLPGEVYFNASPVLNDDVQITYNQTQYATKGVKVAIAATTTIEIDLYSDAPTSGPWSIEAVDYASQFGSVPTVKLSLDKTTGKNGDKLHLTIEPTSAIASVGGEVFMLKSTLGSQTQFAYGFITN